jgi:hypothetical protein
MKILLAMLTGFVALAAATPVREAADTLESKLIPPRILPSSGDLFPSYQSRIFVDRVWQFKTALTSRQIQNAKSALIVARRSLASLPAAQSGARATPTLGIATIAACTSALLAKRQLLLRATAGWWSDCFNALRSRRTEDRTLGTLWKRGKC